VGSDRHNTLHIQHGSVSRSHAELRLRADGWEIKDAGSRNGTWVDGRRVDASTPERLSAGSEVIFGDATAGAWRLEEDGEELIVAVRTSDHELVAGSQGMLQVDTPEGGWTVLSDGDQWKLIDHEGEQVAYDGMVIEPGGPWLLHLPETRSTQWIRGWSVRSCTLVFEQSADGEHHRLVLRQEGRELDLGFRTLWGVLWRLADERAGNSASEGWIATADLAEMLGIAQLNRLEVYLTRIRQELLRVHVFDSHLLIESRRGERRIAVPADRLEL
jgi:hypothetical protein